MEELVHSDVVECAEAEDAPVSNWTAAADA
jgi:hypothetical protein